MKHNTFLLLSVGLMAGLLSSSKSSSAQPLNLVGNGSFEGLPGHSLYDISPWGFTGAYLASAGGFQCQDGINCIGVVAGLFYQDVTTALGQTYQLSFYVAGYAPDGPLPATHNLSVLWDGNVIGTTIFDSTGKTFADMGWSYRSFSVQGTGGTTRLAFINPNANSNPNIPVFDNVQFTPIPEPPCIALISFAGLLALWWGRVEHHRINKWRESMKMESA